MATSSMSRSLLVILVLILVFGLFLRIWQLSSVPISLFGDELDVGLQANSILQTGNDYLGNRLPVMFRSFSEYRLPMLLYLTVPFIKIFGLSELGVRSAPVLMGFITLISFYFLIKELFGKKSAIISTIFMTFSPWHFLYSRQANDAGILLPFVILGTYFFVRAKKGYVNLVFSVIFFALSIYTYAISSLFVPLYFLILLVIFRKETFSLGIKKLMVAGVLGVILLFPYARESMQGSTTARISIISIYNKYEVEAEVIDDRQWVKGPTGKLFYNKASVVLQKLFDSYSESVSPNFLFSQGDPNPRQSVKGFGLLYHFEILLVFVGLFVLAKGLGGKLGKHYKLILSWLILAPLASIFTEGGGTHASRLILMLPPLVFLSAAGFIRIFNWARTPIKKIIFALLIIFMVFDIFYFFNNYFLVWKVQSSRFWQDGFKETIQHVNSIEGDYQRVVLNNNYEPMLPRFLFWSNYDMNKFQKEFTGDIPEYGHLPAFEGYPLGDKYYFGNFEKPMEPHASDGTLVVASLDDVTSPAIFQNGNLTLHKVVNSPQGDPIFYIFSKSSVE